MQNTGELKNKIIQTIQQKGPSLPVHLASAIGQSILFTSAFLSELLAEKRIRTSHMRVGSSPLYPIPGQEPKLENFHDKIKGKEKEALLLLKEQRFLVDIKQHPAIKVALRSLKDFAIPFKKNDDIIWRYFLVPETEYQIKIPEEVKQEQKEVEEKVKEIIKEKAEETIKEEIKEEKPLDIFDTPKEEPKPKKKPVKRTVKKTSASEKKNEKFFNTVKEYLRSKEIEITDIQGFAKSDLTLKVNKQGQEYLLIAYNKKRIAELDITKAYKKAQEHDLQYIILSLGEPTKKMNNFIEAIKNMEEMEKI